MNPRSQPILHPSGGLIYHLRAWRYRDTLWRHYRVAVADWLAAWRPDAPQLALVGPSAGYSLNASFLARFEHILVFEPDPLARWLLRRRFPSACFSFHGTLRAPADLKSLPVDTACLFCNLLGQDWTELAPAAWYPDLTQALAGRPWASYHDIVSSAREPLFLGPSEAIEHLPLEDLLGRFWGSGVLVVDDHESHGLFPELTRQYVVWTLRPGRFHLVEWLQG